MNSENKLYIVTMYRWGDRENHSYVFGVFSDEKVAVAKGEEHGIHRGRKYLPEVIEAEMNQICMGKNPAPKYIISVD